MTARALAARIRKLAIALLTTGCAYDGTIPLSAQTAHSGENAIPSSPAPDTALRRQDDDEGVRWQSSTWSPRPSADSAAPRGCTLRDGALDSVARRIANRRALSLRPPEPAEIDFALKAAGSPHVWPRVWSISGDDLSHARTAESWDRFVSSFHEGGERRCGVATSRSPRGESVIAVVALDAIADLAPLSTRARLGEWIRIDASLRVPVREAKVIALGPRGKPRALPTSLQQREVHAICAVDHPGAWRFQVMADVGNGPRPVLEAMVFVGEDPPTRFVEHRVPGEDSARGIEDAREALKRMLDAARRAEGLQALARDERLDRIAQAQAVKMSRSGRVAHDLGDGDPRERVLRAGLAAKRAGENLAAAATVQRAHRALWASPSHRGNILQSSYDSVGIGVIDDGQMVWICQVFAYFGSAGIDHPAGRTTHEESARLLK